MKNRLSVLVGLSVVFISTSSFAIGLGNVTNSIPNSNAKTAVKVSTKVAGKAIEAGINDKLKKENCHFKNDTTVDQVVCNSGNLSSIVKYLGDWKKGLEATIARNVTVSVTSHAKGRPLALDRAEYVRDEIRRSFSYWDYSIYGSTGGNGLNISVSVRD